MPGIKNAALLCLLVFAFISAAASAQHDSGTVAHPKINIKYSYSYRVKYGVTYKDSTLYGYYFGNDTSYAWNYSESGSDPLMILFMKDDKKAFRHLRRIHRINTIEYIPKAISVIGYGSFIITAYIVFAVEPIVGLAALGISAGVMGTGMGLVALCEHAKKKSFIKGVAQYNHDYGYL